MVKTKCETKIGHKNNEILKKVIKSYKEEKIEDIPTIQHINLTNIVNYNFKRIVGDIRNIENDDTKNIIPSKFCDIMKER